MPRTNTSELHQPDRNLNVALLPLDIRNFQVEANLELAQQRISELPDDVDLIVLPEMFTGGFTPEIPILKRIAERADGGATLESVARWVRSKDAAVAGSFTACDGNNFYNRGFFMAPGEDPIFYDKRHLFSAGGESRIFTAGSAPSPIINFRGWNIKMAICYDIRFPVWNRTVANDYDLLIVPANWVHSRYYAWRHLIIARAIENQCFVLGCNREGSDFYGEYLRFDSMLVDAMGKDIAVQHSDGTLTATLDADSFRRYRTKFTPWRDADDFQLIR